MRVLAQLNNRERTALVVCLAFITGTMLLTLAEQVPIYQIARSMMNPEYQRLRYTGTIVTPEQVAGQCRFTIFDNKTITLQRSEVGECYSRPGVNSPYERINSLREGFKR